MVTPLEAARRQIALYGSRVSTLVELYDLLHVQGTPDDLHLVAARDFEAAMDVPLGDPATTAALARARGVGGMAANLRVPLRALGFADPAPRTSRGRVAKSGRPREADLAEFARSLGEPPWSFPPIAIAAAARAMGFMSAVGSLRHARDAIAVLLSRSAAREKRALQRLTRRPWPGPLNCPPVAGPLPLPRSSHGPRKSTCPSFVNFSRRGRGASCPYADAPRRHVPQPH